MDFNEITKELDLEYFVERESIPFKVSRGSSGMQINVKDCPECGNSKWKVYLNAENGRGNCFACSTGYTKAGYIHKHYGHGDNEWRKTFDICAEVMREQGWRPARVIPAAVSHGVVDMPLSIELPTKDGQNLQYLEDRGINGDLTRYFGLRYCQMGWWNYKDDEGNSKGQHFGERVLIPVYDLDGELKTFQGRDLTGTSDRKYLFPMSLPGTGRYLLNGQNCHLTRRAALGEGFFDVAAMKAAFDADSNLRDVVPLGSFGKHLSYGSVNGDDQLGRFLKLKAAGLQELTIMWDGEVKALMSALDAAKLLTGIGLVVKIAMLPTGKDPNEVIGQVVREVFHKAQRWTPMLDIRLRLNNPYLKK